MEIGYYPGCALHGSSLDYETSVRACMKALDVDLQELEDWICCGATAAHSLNHKLATALPARNLGIAMKMNLKSLFAPCPMCSMELKKANDAIQSPAARAEMEEVVEAKLSGDVDVVNLIQIFQAVGYDAIAEKATRKLDNFKPACYYGCLLTRPPKTLKFDDFEMPTSMDDLLVKLGAAPVDWNSKTVCCGAGLTLCDEETVSTLSGKILKDAVDHGANCVVVACPMCQMNLDFRQSDVKKRGYINVDMPIFYLSDLVGYALGLGKCELGVCGHFVDSNMISGGEQN
ncbi:MAG: CoB--CoM heterodisulfide reductase iron-sulfur subunit B family protein [Thermoguttaceae bacterium]|nr:CoB--CoM heterodisulfide reductase iron-sulfur subunit B family protein [Thermoguttaceae bacterium]